MLANHSSLSVVLTTTSIQYALLLNDDHKFKLNFIKPLRSYVNTNIHLVRRYSCCFSGSFVDVSPLGACSIGPLTCVATVATSLNTEFSTSASFGSGTVSPELCDVSGRIRLQASSRASAGSVPRFLLTRRIVVFGSMLSLSGTQQHQKRGGLTPLLFPGTTNVTQERC